MIPFTTCMKFNRKRLNLEAINKVQQQQHLLSDQSEQTKSTSTSTTTTTTVTTTASSSSSPQPLPPSAATTTTITVTTLTPPPQGNINLGITGIHSVPPLPFLQCPEERLLLTLRRTKTAQRSIHIDPISLLDYSYHGVTDRFLASASKWSFNSFTLDTLTGGHSLSTLLFYLFNKYNFIQEFKLEIINVWKCFRLFENGYHDTNPYHNSIHAADVTQAMHCFIEEEKIGQYLTPMEKMCSLLAAVAHDLDHPGVNQHFLIETKSHLASLYNNLSVLESHHWRFAISCLKESGIFSHFNGDQWSTVQFLLRSLILATDVTQQTNYLKRFRQSLESGTISMATPADRLFIMQIALKCADLGNPCRPWVLSKKWTTQICDEFYRQGDFEKQLNMQVTPIFDRRTASVAHIQIDFYRNIVSPLFQLWDQFLCSKLSRRMLFNLKFNDSQWTNSLEKVNVKRRHSYETMNEKKRKAKDISKSLDDIMLIEEISLDELKEIPKGFCLEDKASSSSTTSSPSSSSSGRPRPKEHRIDSIDDSVDQTEDNHHHHHHHQYHGDDNHGNDDNQDDNDDDLDDDGERMHVGKKQCIGPNGCGTPSPPTEKRFSLPIISMTNQQLTTTISSLISSSSSSSTTAAKSISSSSSTTTLPSHHQFSPSSSSLTPTKQTTSCSSSSSSSSHSHSHHHHHSRHSRHHPHHHHHHHPHHRHSKQQSTPTPQPTPTTTTTQPPPLPLPYISVSDPITQTDCTYIGGGGIEHNAGDNDGGLTENTLFSTYSGLPRVVEQLINYEQSIDDVTCLPHSFSTLPGYSTSSTIPPSYPSQSIVDTAQYLRGRRGSAPGCIGIYTGRDLATAALVFLHGTVSENDDNTLISSSSHLHHHHNHHHYHSQYHHHHLHHPSLSPSHFHPSSNSSSSQVHLKCHSSSSMNPSPTSSSQSSPSSSPPHSSYNQQQQQQTSPPSTTKQQHQRPSLFLTKSNNTNSNNSNSNNLNLESNNKGQKRRSSFPVCDSGHYLSYLSNEGGGFGGSPTIGLGIGGGKLTNRKSSSSYLHGTAKSSSSPRLKGRSLELLMSSLTAKTKLLTNHQSCSLDSAASECRSWLVKREERRGSIPQDILIHSLANYTSANAL